MSRPDVLALGEAARAARELKALGIANQRLVVNGVFQAGADCRPAGGVARRPGERSTGGAAG